MVQRAVMQALLVLSVGGMHVSPAILEKRLEAHTRSNELHRPIDYTRGCAAAREGHELHCAAAAKQNDAFRSRSAKRELHVMVFVNAACEKCAELVSAFKPILTGKGYPPLRFSLAFMVFKVSDSGSNCGTAASLPVTK
jgi:hypothetical protein